MKPKITLFYYNNINTFEEISDLDKCPISQGIWCLYGYKNNTWTCLQVARSTDITAELRSDIANITEPITLEETPYIYINQFGHKAADDFKIYPSIRTQIYSKVGNDYANEKLYFSLLNLQIFLSKKKPKSFSHTIHNLFIGAMEVPTKRMYC